MKHICLLLLGTLLFSCSKEDCGEASIDLQACFDENIEYTQTDQNYKEYIEHFTKWECLDIQNYEVTYTTINQVCPGGVLRLKVENGEVVEQIHLPSSNPYLHQASCRGRTIDELFLSVKYAVDSLDIILGYNEDKFVAYHSDITYNPTYHYPDTVDIRISEWGLDDDFMFILSDFKEIE